MVVDGVRVIARLEQFPVVPIDPAAETGEDVEDVLAGGSIEGHEQTFTAGHHSGQEWSTLSRHHAP